MCKVTKHAKFRIKQRIGINKSVSESIAKKALEDGLKHSDVSGSLNRYLCWLYFGNKSINNLRIYNYRVFLFSGYILVTVINLPYKYRKIIDRINGKNNHKNIKLSMNFSFQNNKIDESKRKEEYKSLEQVLDYSELIKFKDIILDGNFYSGEDIIKIYNSVLKEEDRNKYEFNDIKTALNNYLQHEEKMKKVNSFYLLLKEYILSKQINLECNEYNIITNELKSYYLNHKNDIERYNELEDKLFKNKGYIQYNEVKIGELFRIHQKTVQKYIDILLDMNKVKVVKTKNSTYLKIGIT